MMTQETMLEEMRKQTNYGFAAPLYLQCQKFYSQVLKTAEALGLFKDENKESAHPISKALAYIACARGELKQFMEENATDVAYCPECKKATVGKHTDGKYHCEWCQTAFTQEESK